MDPQATSIPQPRLSGIKKLCALGILSILLFGAALWVWEQGSLSRFLSTIIWFHIRNIKIQCEWPLTSERVQGWLPPLKGKSLLTLDAAALAAQLEGRSWVATVTLKKEFPDSLYIEISSKKAAAIGLFKGKPYFLDAKGLRIEKVSPDLLKAADLPVLSFEKDAEVNRWQLEEFLPGVERLQKLLDPGYSISQITFGRFPYFRVYLNRPRWEVTFSRENWETQVPMLLLLLHHPPRQIRDSRRINLVFPKKAVVSTPQTQ